MTTVSKLLSLLMFIRVSSCDYIPQWSCNFENGLCLWLQVKDDKLDFIHVVGSDVGWEDHTTNSSNGKFLYLLYENDDAEFEEEKAANIMSPVLMPNNGSCKMVLHYKISGFHTVSKVNLFVNMITKHSSGTVHRNSLFQTSGATSWKRIDVILQSNEEFQVEISGLVSATNTGRMGIDDIWFTADCLTNEETPIRLIKLWSLPPYNLPYGVFYERSFGLWSAICSEENALYACNLLGFKAVETGNHSSINDHLKSGQGICLPNNITVPTSEVCNHESSCRNVTYWECKQDFLSACPSITHITCAGALEYPECVSYNHVCDYHDDCLGGEDEFDCIAYERCNFQTDMCDWSASKKVLYEWKRYYNQTSGEYYLNVDSTHAFGKSGIAKLKFKHSIQGMLNVLCCIRFAYRAAGKMTISIEENNKANAIWSSKSSGDQWKQELVYLPHNRTYQLVFEAFVTGNVTSTNHFGLGYVSFSRDCKFTSHTNAITTTPSTIHTETLNPATIVTLLEDCSQHTQATQHMSDYMIFGKIEFNRTAKNTNHLAPGFCSWKGPGNNGFHYLLEFQSIDTGSMVNVLKVNYQIGKAIEFRGFVNTKELTLIQASGNFNITIEINSEKSCYMRMVYSVEPGCYSTSLQYTYTALKDNELYCEGDRFAFQKSIGQLYCGNYSPASYGVFMRHPYYCSVCKTDCEYGYLFTTVYYKQTCPKMSYVTCTSSVEQPHCPGNESDCLAYNCCDFQSDMCDWVTANSKLYKWTRYYNHTLGRYCLNVNFTLGYYMSGTAQLRLKYLLQGNSNSACNIRFAYRAIGKMAVILKDGNETESIWSTRSSRGHWHQAIIQLPSKRSFELFFEASISNGITSFNQFGLANISFSKDCKFINHSFGSTADQCDFESSFCNWQIGNNAPEQPRRWKANTPSYFTGLVKDNTNNFKSGYYVYLEATNAKPGAYGYLLSRTMQRSLTSRCTVCWFYHMLSNASYETGKLSIIYKNVENQSEAVLWHVQGASEDAWKFASVTFDITSFLYQIIIKFERSFYGDGDIAIDDVSIGHGCQQVKDFNKSIIITKNIDCPAVRLVVNGSSASVYQVGSGRVFCDVTLRTDPRLRINLYAEFFNTDSNKDVVIDAGGIGSISYGGSFSGSLRPFSLISATNTMTIRVPPLEGIGSHSFAFNITSTDQPAHSATFQRHSAGPMRLDVVRGCYERIAKFTFFKSGTIKPELYTGYYYFSQDCIFKFFAPNGYRIKFIFQLFDIDYGSSYIEILNNGIIGQNRFSGYRSPFQFISKRSHVEMVFVTGHFVSRSGFVLNISATDDNASAAAPLPESTPTLYAGSPLSQTCSYQTHPRQYAHGDFYFGEIMFNREASNTSLFIPRNCSWRVNGITGARYLLEFQHIETGSLSNILRVRYSNEKSIEFKGHVLHEDLIDAGSQIDITMEINSDTSSNIRIVYAKSPACYDAVLSIDYAVQDNATSGCRCKGYKYSFVGSDCICYCGNFPPLSYGFSMENPQYCESCTTSARHGSLSLNTIAGGPLSKVNNGKNLDSRIGLSTVTAIVAVAVSIALLLFSVRFGIWFYQRKKARTSACRSGAVTGAADQGEDICLNVVQEPQTIVQPGIVGTIASLTDTSQGNTNNATSRSYVITKTSEVHGNQY